MKFSSLILAAFTFELASAFSPSFLPKVSQSKANMIDPNSISDIAQDAARLVFLECDNHGCAMSEAVKAGNEWHVNHGLEAGAQGGATYEKVLMIAMEGNSE